MSEFTLLVDLHDALVLAGEHASDMDVLKFIHSSTEFAAVRDFLHDSARPSQDTSPSSKPSERNSHDSLS